MDGDLVDTMAHPQGLGGDFGAEVEASADELHAAEQVGGEELVAGGLVGEMDAEEQVTDQGDDLAPQQKAEVGERVLPHLGMAEFARAIDDGGAAATDRRQEQIE